MENQYLGSGQLKKKKMLTSGNSKAEPTLSSHDTGQVCYHYVGRIKDEWNLLLQFL